MILYWNSNKKSGFGNLAYGNLTVTGTLTPHY